uniref:non-specific serine/threonine protein kinase n=1 Tax=Lactuca sativa TaxID=4236 RepID=A0A9R1W5P6_LACSA|nr:hypothetical protein LSAT_V11C200066400 [Lactuca sativa]
MTLCKDYFSMLMHTLLFISTDSFTNSGFQQVDTIENHDCSCFGNNHRWVDQHAKQVLTFGLGPSAVSGVILVMIILNIIVFKLSQLQETNDKKPPSFSQEHLCRRFPFTEMKLATNNFDEDMVIGKGGFGKVYKGVIDYGATRVAIKRMDYSRSKQGATEFWTEIKLLSKFRHRNLVSLIGLCDEFNEMIIVYEYVSGGNLGERVHKVCGKTTNSPLSWVERVKICVGAARGLDYLHTGTNSNHRIIHRDVKSSNILLDEYMEAKVSDLGVSKIGPLGQPFTHVSTDVKGSFGYFDPNYFMTRRLTRKSDVYSFGVVLLEVLCGRPAIDPTLGENELGLVGWAMGFIKEGVLDHIIDPSLKGQIIPDCLKAFVGIIEKCLKTRPKERPTMTEVVVELEAVLVMQEKANSFVLESCSRYENEERGNLNPKSGKITFSRMFRSVFPVKTSATRVEQLEKKKGQSICLLSCTMSNKDDLLSKTTNSFHEVNFKREVINSRLKVFTVAELKITTRNFSNDMIAGEGAFGKVFKGWVEHETFAPSKVAFGMAVAVKKLNTDGYQGFEEWQAEVTILGRLSHPNLVHLIGYCCEDKDLFLIYEFMNKGSLENYILKKGFGLELPWSMRLKIMIGTARGLAFLHSTENQIIFRDLKSSNILLDQDFNAKICDFGLAIHGPTKGDTHIMTEVMGTHGYVAPEYVATGDHFPLNSLLFFTAFTQMKYQK